MVEEQAEVPDNGDASAEVDPAEEAWRDAIEEHCDRFLGPCPNVVAETSSDLVRIDLDPYLPAHNRERTTLLTVGVSTKATVAPDAMAQYRHIELFTYLPSNWSYGTDEAHWWPCRMLKDVGRLVHRLETWYAPGQLLGGDPEEALTDESLLTGVVLLPPVYEDPAFDQLEIDGKSCRFLWAFPLTTPEIEFAQERGVSRLLELMAERDVQLPLDSRRACMITGKKYGDADSSSRSVPESTAQHSSHPSVPPTSVAPSQPPARHRADPPQHQSGPPQHQSGPPRHQSGPPPGPYGPPPQQPRPSQPQYGPPPGAPYGGAPQQRPPVPPPQPGPPQGQALDLWNKIQAGIEQRLNRLLQTDGFLVVEEASSGYYVMLASNRQRGTLVCEAVSNQFLPSGRRLAPDQEQRMRALGWSPPGQGEASGTWNYARTLHVPIKVPGVSRVAVATLRDIYRCDPHKLSYTGNPTAVADVNEPFNPS